MRQSPRVLTAATVAAIAGAALPGRAWSRPVGSLFPASINLSTLDGVIGFTLHGAAPNDASGLSVASAGDINGDGVDDLLIGAPSADAGGLDGNGSTYVVFGKNTAAAGAFPVSINLSTINGTNGFRLDGAASEDFSGQSVAPAGDVNGDGVDDLFIGAASADPGGRNYAGSTYVVFGKNTAAAGAFPAAINLSMINGTNGFRLDGAAAFDFSGRSVAPAGDINGDGVDDLLIGAPGASPGGRPAAGSTYVVFGRDFTVGGFPASLPLSALNGTIGFRLDGAAAEDASGASVASAGDINDDGVDDLIIGAPLANPPGGVGTDAGSAYVVFGRNTAAVGSFPATLALSTLDGTNGFRLDGVRLLDHTGTSVASAGDINGDGVDDVLIGANAADAGGGNYSNVGSTYVIFGKNTATAGAFPASINPSTINGMNGFRIDGAASLDASGISVASAGDTNGDGVDDVLIGAIGADPGGRSAAGSSFIVFGRNTAAAGAFPATVNLSILNGANGFRLDGVAANDFSGDPVSSAGDINGDGVDDLLVGAYRADPGGRTNAGSTYVVFGRSDAMPPCPGDANGDLLVNFADLNIVLSEFGMSGSGLAGDLNADGIVNFTDLNIVLSFFGTAC